MGLRCEYLFRENINDRVPRWGRGINLTEPVLSRQWPCASCIQLFAVLPSECSVTILSHLFYFDLLQYIFVNSRTTLSIERNVQAYKLGYIRGFYETESSPLALAYARKISVCILSDFALTPFKYRVRIFRVCGDFAGAIGIPRDRIYLQLR